ncbi:MAG: aminodeoxychorismate/anthranilate synthase component II [bacterium]|nr:aminodeoxychorismate/anthranilate synthase component II [bacterium]
MILLIDNYDSFTFNLYQSLAGHGAEVRVERNDALEVDEVLGLEVDAVVLSPGPGRPAGAGICLELLQRLPERTALLGVCLGHQALVESEGGALEVDAAPVHGKASLVHHDGTGLFETLPNPLPCGRYHSLRAVRDALPGSLTLTAWTEDGHVMGVRHRSLPRFGVQFHPESILTPEGDRLLARFLSVAAH